MELEFCNWISIDKVLSECCVISENHAQQEFDADYVIKELGEHLLVDDRFVLGEEN